jgi:hypothetical protein
VQYEILSNIISPYDLQELQILWTPSDDDNEKEACDTNSDCSFDSFGLYDDYEDDCDTSLILMKKKELMAQRVIIPLMMLKTKFLMLHLFVSHTKEFYENYWNLPLFLGDYEPASACAERNYRRKKRGAQY